MSLRVDQRSNSNKPGLGWLFPSQCALAQKFHHWNLDMYLQAKNPNVPDIPNKLIKLPVRKALAEQRKNFWDIVINELGSVDCIYTNKKLVVGNYAVEHFVPYASYHMISFGI